MAFGWDVAIDYSYPLVVACDSVGVHAFADFSSNSNSCSCSGGYCRISSLALVYAGSATGNSDGDAGSGYDGARGVRCRIHSNVDSVPGFVGGVPGFVRIVLGFERSVLGFVRNVLGFVSSVLGFVSSSGLGFVSSSGPGFVEAESVVNRKTYFDFSSRASYDATHHRYLCSVRLKRLCHLLSFSSSCPLRTFHRSCCRKLPLQRHR